MKRALQERELSPGGEVLDEFLDSSVACYPRLGAWGVGGWQKENATVSL